MKVELINEKTAFERFCQIQQIAESIMTSSGKLMSECTSPECRDYLNYCFAYLSLQAGEVMIFINGQPARLITEFQVLGGSNVIGTLCAANLFAATLNETNDLLTLEYTDGVKEYYTYNKDDEFWIFQANNVKGLNLPNRNAN